MATMTKETVRCTDCNEFEETVDWPEKSDGSNFQTVSLNMSESFTEYGIYTIEDSDKILFDFKHIPILSILKHHWKTHEANELSGIGKYGHSNFVSESGLTIVVGSDTARIKE